MAFLVSLRDLYVLPFSMRKDILYESVKKFVKTRKEDLNAYFTASLRIRKFITSCCENVCDWLWKQLPLIESRVFCRVWRLSRVVLLIFYSLWYSCLKLLCKYQNAFYKSELRFSCCIILFYRKERWSSSYKPSYLSCGWCCWAWGWGLHWCWGRLVRSKYLLSCLCWLCYIHDTNEKPCFLFVFW